MFVKFQSIFHGYLFRKKMAAVMMLNQTGPQALAYGSGGMNFGYPDGISVSDMVPEHIKHMIHPHWDNFPPVNPMWHYLLGVVYLFLGAISLFGECSLLWCPEGVS